MKESFVQQMTIIATALAQSFAMAETLVNTYFDRGYNSGGANELSSDDLAPAGLTVGDVASAITLFQQIEQLRNSGAVASADYDSTLNKLRRDL